MALPDRYKGDFAAGILPRVRDGVNIKNQVGVQIDFSTSSRVSSEQEMIELAKRIDEETDELILDDAVYNFVRAWSEGGTIKELKMKMFGLSGRGGYWYMPKLQDRISKEPDVYGLIMGTMWNSFTAKSEQGGQFSIDLFETLLVASEAIYSRVKVPATQVALQEVMMAAIKRGVYSHDLLSDRLKMGGVVPESLWDFARMEIAERDALFTKVLSALSVPKTPQR